MADTTQSSHASLSFSKSYFTATLQLLHGYFTATSQLHPRDFGPRVQFAECFFGETAAVEEISERVLFTDEAHSARGGVPNTHHFHH